MAEEEIPWAGWAILPWSGPRIGTLQIKEHPTDSKEATEDRDMALVASKHWVKSLSSYYENGANFGINCDPEKA